MSTKKTIYSNLGMSLHKLGHNHEISECFLGTGTHSFAPCQTVLGLLRLLFLVKYVQLCACPSFCTRHSRSQVCLWCHRYSHTHTETVLGGFSAWLLVHIWMPQLDEQKSSPPADHPAGPSLYPCPRRSDMSRGFARLTPAADKKGELPPPSPPAPVSSPGEEQGAPTPHCLQHREGLGTIERKRVHFKIGKF